MELALFDFDGTITREDSLTHFIKFARGSMAFKISVCLLSPFVIGYYLRVIPGWYLKQLLLKYHFGGSLESEFNAIAGEYAQRSLPSIVKASALKEIREHLAKGSEVAVVSASLYNYLSPWCKTLGINLIATRLEAVDGKITGKLSSKNCFGREKVIRIKEVYEPGNYTRIHAYGDSRGNKEMLSLAHEAYYRKFKE